MTSTDDVQGNAARAEALVRSAAGGGAAFVCLPEYVQFYGPQEAFARVAEEDASAFLERFSALARELGIVLSLGSVLLPGKASGRVRNTSVLLGPDGAELGRYVKRHLFDVDLPGRRFRESDVLEPGDEAVAVGCEGWTVGLAICFDLRFAAHFAELRARGADLLLVPSAFTEQTGRAHWQALLRARAIETQSYVAAAAQWGACQPGKRCHGHSMIVDPWGEVRACRPEGTGVVSAELDPARVREVRASVPMGG
jgi:deaminated glutathione amidase